MNMKMTLKDSVVALWMKGQRRWGAQPTNGGAQVHSATKATPQWSTLRPAYHLHATTVFTESIARQHGFAQP
jgi:hypothetical protein